MSEASLDVTTDGFDEMPVHIIQRTRGFQLLDLSELWAYRELLYFLAWRDIKVRYKQTAVGVLWSVLQPAAMMVVFTFFFGRLAQIPSQGIPYPVFALVALVPWQLFSKTISESTSSLISDQRLITRVYFPRILIPTANTVAGVVDFLVAAGLLGLVMLWYGITPGVEVVWLPVFLILLLATALGAGYWLSALNVEFRDVAYVVPFLNQFWLFITPVVYPASLVPEKWRPIYGLNPMVGVIEGFRWALLGVGEGPSPTLFVSAAVALTLFVTGIMWFRRRERTFVDTIGSGGR